MRQKQFADRKRRELDFSEGESCCRRATSPCLVLLLSCNLNGLGPTRSKRRSGNLAYKLEIPADWRVHDVFSNLKPFVINPEQFAGRPTRAKPVAFARDGVPLYEPEAILNRMWLHFPGKSKPEWGYLIQWKDFSEHDTTWEPIENLSGSKQLLEAYNTPPLSLQRPRKDNQLPARLDMVLLLVPPPGHRLRPQHQNPRHHQQGALLDSSPRTAKTFPFMHMTKGFVRCAVFHPGFSPTCAVDGALL